MSQTVQKRDFSFNHVKKFITSKPLTECLWLPGGPFGYNEVAMIPAGATHIRVTDNSRNYLGKIQPVTHTHTGHLVCCVYQFQLSAEDSVLCHWLHSCSVNQALQIKTLDLLLLPLPRDTMGSALPSGLWTCGVFSRQHDNQGHLFSSLFMRPK